MSTPATSKQVPEHSLYDQFNKQNYLGNQFILSTPVTNLATTAETNLALILNPVSTTSFPSQKSVFFNLRKFASDNQIVLIRFYVNPTISSVGTPTASVCMRPATSNVSVAECYGVGQFTTSANGSIAGSIGCPSNFYITLESTEMFILDPGTSILITGQAVVSNTNVLSELSWYDL